MGGKTSLQTQGHFGIAFCIDQLQLQIHYPVLHIHPADFIRDPVDDILTTIRRTLGNTVTAFLEDIAGLGVDIVFMRFSVPDLMQQFHAVVHDFFFAEFYSGDPRLVVRCLIQIIKTGN